MLRRTRVRRRISVSYSGLGDAGEHFCEGGVHVGPELAERLAPRFRDMHFAHPHVVLAWPAADQAVALHAVERAAHRGLLGDGVDRKLVHRRAGHQREHRERAHLDGVEVMLLELRREVGVPARDDAVQEIGREMIEADLAERRDAPGLARLARGGGNADRSGRFMQDAPQGRSPSRRKGPAQGAWTRRYGRGRGSTSRGSRSSRTAAR